MRLLTRSGDAGFCPVVMQPARQRAAYDEEEGEAGCRPGWHIAAAKPTEQQQQQRPLGCHVPCVAPRRRDSRLRRPSAPRFKQPGRRGRGRKFCARMPRASLTSLPRLQRRDCRRRASWPRPLSPIPTARSLAVSGFPSVPSPPL
ncbi:hypothetical protein MRX96_021813 [Rhipicephalus microplus]